LWSATQAESGPRQLEPSTTGGQRGPKGFRIRPEEKALKAKPQERYRHETRPEGSERRNPLGGRETLEGERTGRGKPGVSGLSLPKALKGEKPHERGAVREQVRVSEAKESSWDAGTGQ